MENKRQIDIVNLREHPALFETAAAFIHGAWGNEGNRRFYYEAIQASLHTDAPLPRWFVALDGEKPVACCGLIPNDFVSRCDLWPWICAVYTAPEYRGRGLGGKVILAAARQAGRLGFPRAYIFTDHTGYYERYGWEYMGEAAALFGGAARVYVRPTGGIPEKL